MKATKKIASVVLALLLTVGMISLNGTTNVYATEADDTGITEKSISEPENEGAEGEVGDTEGLTEETVEKEETVPAVETEPVTATGEVSGSGWKLSETGVLTLLEDVEFVSGQSYEWEQYAEQITEVVVAEGVTEIPNLAFSTNYKNLKKVTMSSTVKVIKVAAFAYNPNLTEVHLNDGLETVENIAFACAGFTKIKLPEGVEWYSDVFYECDNLESITIPKGSKWGKSNAHFYGCDSLRYVIIEEGVTEIPATFLNECEKLQYVWIPKSVTIIEGTAILNGACIIGYKGTIAEEYTNSPAAQNNKVTFHAIDGDEHTFGGWETVQKPTYTEEGIRKHSCTICNATEEETIAKLVPSENNNSDSSDKVQEENKGNTEKNQTSAHTSSASPKTGDTADVFAWTLMIVSAGAIAGFCLKKRTAK